MAPINLPYVIKSIPIENNNYEFELYIMTPPNADSKLSQEVFLIHQDQAQTILSGVVLTLEYSGKDGTTLLFEIGSNQYPMPTEILSQMMKTHGLALYEVDESEAIKTTYQLTFTQENHDE